MVSLCFESTALFVVLLRCFLGSSFLIPRMYSDDVTCMYSTRSQTRLNRHVNESSNCLGSFAGDTHQLSAHQAVHELRAISSWTKCWRLKIRFWCCIAMLTVDFWRIVAQRLAFIFVITWEGLNSLELWEG